MTSDLDALWLAVEQSPADLDRWRVLADALNDAGKISDEEEIRAAVAEGEIPFPALRKRFASEVERRYREIADLKARQVALMVKCPHKRTRYIEDASGNSDWYDQCLDCGAEGKHL